MDFSCLLGDLFTTWQVISLQKELCLQYFTKNKMNILVLTIILDKSLLELFFFFAIYMHTNYCNIKLRD